MKQISALLAHYLLTALTIAFAAGIVLHRFLSLPLHSTIVPAALLLTASTLYYCRDRNSQVTVFFLLLSATTLGLLHADTFAARSLQEEHIARRITQQEDVVLIGTLANIPLFDGRKSTILIDCHTLRIKDESSFSPVHGRVRLSMKGPWPEEFLPGEELVIRTHLSRPYRFGTPGSFDYPTFLAQKDIWVIGRIHSPIHIHPLTKHSSLTNSLRYFPERTRLAVQKLLDRTFTPQQAGIYRALLIGDRSGIAPEVLEDFKAAGVMHILAISGLHLSLLASGLFLLCYWLARRSQYLMLRFSAKKLALLATIPPLCGYGLLAGAQTPVLRALIMVLVFILAFCVNRQRSPFTTLSLAGLIILLWNPFSLFTISFQLSFMAVASLILILPQLTGLIKQKVDPGHTLLQRTPGTLFRWTWAALLISVTATIGTAPLLILAFNRLSLVGPVANLFLEPLLCLWSLPLGLLSIGLLFISPESGEWLLHLGGLGIAIATKLADLFASLPSSALWLPTPPVPLVLLYYLALALCFIKTKRRTTVPLFVSVCCLFFFPVQGLTDKFSTSPEITFLDVGQGSSSLLSFPGGKKILIDGGGSSSKKFNVGEQLIAPYLWQRGISRLEAIVITHADADHYNGIPFLLQRFHPKTLWINGSSGHDQGYDDLLSLARDLDIAVKTPENGELLLERRGTKLINLGNPFQNSSKSPLFPSLSSNDKSLILQVQAPSFTALFPGDISERVEQVLLKDTKDRYLHSTLLLSPHHGSRTSNSKEFLDAVNPEHIVVSASRFPPLLFPSQQVRDYCRQENIPLLNTADIGSITVAEQDNKLQISTFFSSPEQ